MYFAISHVHPLLSGPFALTTCGGDSSTNPTPSPPSPPPPPPPPAPVSTRIEIIPSSARLNAIGQTVQLAARVLDQNGSEITGASFTWWVSAGTTERCSHSHSIWPGLPTAMGVHLHSSFRSRNPGERIWSGWSCPDRKVSRPVTTKAIVPPSF